MKARQLKEEFIKFFVSKNHVEIPSASLIPENDPTTLFISAGMHPLVPYLLGQPHPAGKRLVNIQKCVRTGDIDDVGDTVHHTFFEMLGNWSLGDYFKEESISWSFEFLTKYLDISVKHLSVTCFKGDSNSPKDEESANIWKSLGVKKNKFLGKDDNWWGPAGKIGPCGPDTEIFFDGIEIWNNVFMQSFKDKDGNYKENSQINVDTGMGIERTTAVLSGFLDNYLTDIWQPIIKTIEKISKKLYTDDNNKKSIRIIADHIRSAVFIIADGVEPSNKEAGYVLRRLIRRAIRQGKILEIESNFTSEVAKAVLSNQDNYAGVYLELDKNKDKILSVLETEENKFRKTLDRGLKEIRNMIAHNIKITGAEIFKLYESFGFPPEMTKEELKSENWKSLFKEFEKFKLKHQQQSKTLSAGKFKSGLADDSEIIIKYHTATHLLHSALRKVLGDHVQQSGSNITAERLRFDFTNTEKLTEDQIKEISDLVNQQINKSLPITKETILFTEAQKQGALAFFGNKYPETVSVFSINDFSKEVCTGPHVENTKELGKFEITKEESAGSGKRRIYAVLK
jgi:alanyl-tRNA synthetase